MEWSTSWGAVRLDGILEDRHHDEAEGEFVSALHVSLSPTSHQEGDHPAVNVGGLVRAIKENPFPASFLKIKQYVSSKGENLRLNLCWSSLLDIVTSEKAHIQRIPSLHVKNGIRRTRLHRKIDWDTAATALTGSSSSCGKLLCEMGRCVVSWPVMPNVLLRACQWRLTFHVHAVPQLKPPRTTMIADIMSNLLFDAELLSRETRDFTRNLRERERLPDAALQYNSGCSTQLRFRASAIGNASVPKHSQRIAVSIPLMKQFLLSKIPKHSHDATAVFDVEQISPFSPGCSQIPFEAFARGIGFPSRLLNDLFWRDKKPVAQIRSAVALIRQLCEDSNNYYKSVPRSELRALESYFTKEEACDWTPPSHPILTCKTFCTRRLDKRVLNLELWPERVIAVGAAPAPEALLMYVRHRFVHETGLWCQGSREVLRRSREVAPGILISTRKQVASPEVFKALRSLPIHSHADSAEQSANGGLAFLDLLAIPKQFPSNKWRKISLTITGELSANKNLGDQKRLRDICNAVNSFDPPKRRQSLSSSRTIKSRYDCAADNDGQADLHCDFFDRHTDVDNESYTSILGDMCLSGDGINDAKAPLNSLLSLVGREGKFNVHNVVPTDTAGCAPVQTTASPSATGAGVASPTDKQYSGAGRRVSSSVPSGLVCASWALKIAERCLGELRKGVVFLPPQLSGLPIVACLTSSVLLGVMADHRVVIVCHHDSDAVLKVAAYLNFAYRGQVSIASFRNSDQNANEATLSKTTARISVLDSFDHPAADGVSMLVIFGTGVALSRLSNSGFDNAPANVYPGASRWGLVPSIFVIPNNLSDTVVAFADASWILAEAMSFKDALYVAEEEDIHHAVLLSSPRFIFLIPSPAAFEILKLLEADALAYFRVYAAIKQQTCDCHDDTQEVKTLDGVDVVLLKRYMESHSDSSPQFTQVEMLYRLCQARKYALHDGHQTAISYMRHCRNNASSQCHAMWDSLAIAAKGYLAAKSDELEEKHPILISLQECLTTMRELALNQPPSLRSVTRREVFRPLVVTSSKETYHGILKGLDNAAEITCARPGETIVCELQQLSAWKGSEPVFGKAGDSETFSEVSHVIQVADGKIRSTFLSLPPELMQYVHAGRTRLLTIAVDETREMEHSWRANESLYTNLGISLRRTSHTEILSQQNCYIKTISLQSIRSTMNALTAPEETCATAGKVPLHFEKACGHVNVGQPLAASRIIQLSAQEVCGMSADNLRINLRSRYQHAWVDNKEPFTIAIFIPQHENCSPATTYLLAALAKDTELIRNVEVRTTF